MKRRGGGISRDPLPEERQLLGGGKINVESLLLLEPRPGAQSLAHQMGEGGRRPGEGSDYAEIDAGAWDYERINRRYARHLKILGERPGGALRSDATAKALLRWAAAEREAWLEAVANDPLFAGPDSAVRLPGATGTALLKFQICHLRSSEAWSQPATAHVQTRIARCKTLLPLQQKFVMGVGGNGWAATAVRWRC